MPRANRHGLHHRTMNVYMYNPDSRPAGEMKAPQHPCRAEGGRVLTTMARQGREMIVR